MKGLELINIKKRKKSYQSSLIDEAYRRFILQQNHPCIMARSVFKLENYQLKIYESMQQEQSFVNILTDLENFIANYDFNDNKYKSFIASFPHDEIENETEFEVKLWQFLQRLHNLDDVSWDQSVSYNPDDSNFSFSLKGKAFYIVGMHPKSSRLARRSPYVTVIFNLHHQFEKLRELGTYKKIRRNIRKRDKNLQGSINPVMSDFGEVSEARQYSGRNVESDWKCPFHSKIKTI